MRAFGLTDVGFKRTMNQDAFFVDNERQIYIVADGMGGHKAGDLASRTALDAICDYVYEQKVFNSEDAVDSKENISELATVSKEAIKYANKIIYQKANETMEYHGMGTRSWSSLLTLKSFIDILDKTAIKEQSVFFPILAIEEPEAHLHPNAQKKL